MGETSEYLIAADTADLSVGDVDFTMSSWSCPAPSVNWWYQTEDDTKRSAQYFPAEEPKG